MFINVTETNQTNLSIPFLMKELVTSPRKSSLPPLASLGMWHGLNKVVINWSQICMQPADSHD